MMMFGCVDGLGLDLRKMINYIEIIESRYLSRDQVHYHNAVHATDVLQASACMLNLEDVRCSLLDPVLSSFAVLFSAAIHDVAHPGRNQAFQVKTQSELAILYSDRSVLEHHHLAVAFSTLRKHAQVNFLDVLEESDFKLFREKVIQMVLSTDMATHLENMNGLKDLVHSSRPLSRAKNQTSLLLDKSTEPVSEEMHSVYEADNNVLLCSIVHCADISNVAKPWEIYRQWIPLLFSEFFDQGDEERRLGFEIGLVFDREACYPCEMQSYFIDLFVGEYVDILAVWCPDLGALMSENITQNKKHLAANHRTRIHDMWTTTPSPSSSTSASSSSSSTTTATTSSKVSKSATEDFSKAEDPHLAQTKA